MLACLRGLLDRLRAATYAAARDQYRLEHGAADYLQDAEAFLRFLLDVALQHIHPAAPHRLQINALTALKLFVSTSLASDCALRATAPLPINAQKPLAWPFQLAIATRPTTDALLRCLLSTFSDVKQAAMDLLLSFPTPLCGLETDEDWDRAILTPMRRLQANTRESEAQSAVMLAQLYFQRCESKRSGFLDQTVQSLEERVTLAERDLAMASEDAPLHGTLATLASLMALRQAPVADDMQLCLLRMVERIFVATSSILTSNSLEGTAVTDHEESRALAFDDENLVGAAGPRHKVMLSTSWRAVKEAAWVLLSSFDGV
jgi:hypothetical protein